MVTRELAQPVDTNDPMTRSYNLSMTWGSYAAFAVFAAVVVLAPGPDFAVVVKNTLRGGCSDGRFTAAGVVASCVVQGTAAALGIGVVIARSQQVFLAIRWIGVAYLLYLGVQALLSLRSNHESPEPSATPRPSRVHPAGSFRQGFLSNITNPKVLALYLSVLPQFLRHAGTPTVDALALAYTHAALGIIWLLTLVQVMHRLRPLLRRRRVARAMEAAAGTALVGFATVLAVEAR
jgi:threonine/homoserine/homoserine lactone efflux protein